MRYVVVIRIWSGRTRYHLKTVRTNTRQAAEKIVSWIKTLDERDSICAEIFEDGVDAQ